mmetsp:Transcript_15580/g.23209  ORF Transcript_15580/g.23209 Transcript_15580/m.23209 type:complete len:374 (-) Transcript_15580:78-1199(-)
MHATKSALVLLLIANGIEGFFTPTLKNSKMRSSSTVEEIVDTIEDSVTPIKDKKVELGDFKVAPLGIGTWQWGDNLYWEYKKSMDAELQETFDFCVYNGINFFDTAEIYGFGRSEYLCGKFRRDYKSKNGINDDLVIATKFAAFPLPTRLNRKAVVNACKRSLDRMGQSSIELYQIHFPSIVKNEEYWEGLADCYDQGLVKTVGVSNYGPEMLQKAYDALQKRGVPLSSNQVQYNILYRKAETNGLIEKCNNLGVKIIAYSPLAQGLLTGKYSQSNLPTGPRSRNFKQYLNKSEDLLNLLKKISEEKEKNVSQIALAWCISKGVIPIAGVKNLSQAEENIGALDCQLSEEQIKEIDTLSDNIKFKPAGDLMGK